MLDALLKPYRKEDGNVAIITAIMLPALLLLMLGAIQLSNITSLRRSAQAAMDAAVLAATLELGRGATEVEAEEVGRRTFAANLLSAPSGLDPLVQPTFTFRSEEEDVFVNSEYESVADVIFTGFFGLPTYTVSVQSGGFISVPRDEITMVLDVSGSMAGDKIAALRLAATSFVNAVEPFTPTNGSYRLINLIPFANRVNFGPDLDNLLAPETPEYPDSFFVGCFEPEAPDDQASNNDVNVGQLLPYEEPVPEGNTRCPREESRVLFGSDDTVELVERIENLKLSGGTGTDHALSWGWRSLSPQWRPHLDMPFSLPRPFQPRNRKILVLLTDGRVFNIDWVTDADGNRTTQTRDGAESLANFEQVCEAIETEDEITVYTIGYELTDDTSGLREVLIDCATDDGQYFDADVSQLSAVFAVIADDVNSARLVN